MMNHFLVDGSSNEKIGRFSVWRVVDVQKQEAICSFHGPMSFMCAVAACRALNSGLTMVEAQDYFKDNNSADIDEYRAAHGPSKKES